VWLTELAPLSEPGLVPQAVARALGVSEQPGHPLLGTLTEALRDKELLLVLDNCEHLIQATSNLAEALLSSCSRLRILATSREPLGVGGEAVRQVGPLSLPETTKGGLPAGDLMGCAAVRLFVERARATVPDFSLTEGNAGAVVRVCQRLDGIPLAIELAAAQLRALAVEQVAGRLEGSLDLLHSSSRTAEPKQQTLRATLDWSHKLLGEDERALMGRLSVIAGGWTLEAAEQVCSGRGIEQYEVLDLLGGLVDKSFVVAGTASEGAVRYRMLEPIRQYAREKLEVGGGAEEARGRHAAFYLALAEEAGPGLAGTRSAFWIRLLEEEHDNLRAALSWAREREEGQGLRFGAVLWRFWLAEGYLSEGINWLDAILAGGEQGPERVRALEGLGWLAQYQGDIERANAAYREMLKLSRESDDRGNVATALNSLGTLAVSAGDNEQAKRYLEENLSVLRQLEEEEHAATTLKRYHASNLLGILALNEDKDPARATALWKESLALAREAGDALRIGVSLCSLGYAAVLQGDNERATALSEETLAFAREHQEAGEEVVPETLVNLGLAALGQGEYERAISSFDEALAMSQSAGTKASLINALEGMASLAGAREEDPLAARLWGAADAAREVTGIALPPGDRALHEPRLAAARYRLGKAEWEVALTEGQKMSLEEAAEYVFSRAQADPPTTPVPQKPSTGEPARHLSGREWEVAVLVARGLTNRQISAHLGISGRTVGNHVGNILGKLGLRSRTQIATWAIEHELLTPDPE
jgi:predicted ATPase/DNA-binding CsgD family transcriptional regulator/Tfp pilus assembly protein PilF